MLTDFQVDVLTYRLKHIKRNKRRFEKLRTIWQGNIRECKRTVDDISDAASTCLVARNLIEAMTPVSKSPVWQSISLFLREERRKQMKTFGALKQARLKAFAKARRTYKMRLEVADALRISQRRRRNRSGYAARRAFLALTLIVAA